MAIPNSSEPLSPSEFESLKELSKGAPRKAIPPEDMAALKRLGYAKEGFGGAQIITDAGRWRLTKGS
jgi:hypothetical protein